MNETKMTEAEFVKLFKLTRPHLIRIEEEAERVGFGTIQISMEVRNNIVKKIEFFEKRTWLRDKEDVNVDKTSNQP